MNGDADKQNMIYIFVIYFSKELNQLFHEKQIVNLANFLLEKQKKNNKPVPQIKLGIQSLILNLTLMLLLYRECLINIQFQFSKCSN